MEEPKAHVKKFACGLGLLHITHKRRREKPEYSNSDVFGHLFFQSVTGKESKYCIEISISKQFKNCCDIRFIIPGIWGSCEKKKSGG